MLSNYSMQVLGGVGLGGEAARVMAPKLVVTSLDAEAVVWQKGQFIGSWTYVISGVVAGCSPVLDSPSLPMTLYGPQSWFGELPILNQEPTILEYVCATEVQLMSMPSELFRDAIGREDKFTASVVQLLARRQQLHTDLLVSLKLGSPVVRSIFGLAQIAEALSLPVRREDIIEIPVKQSFIASMCGVSRTLLSDYLRHLQVAGWVRVHYGRLELLHARAWVKLARTMHHYRRFAPRSTMGEMLQELHRASH